MEAKPILTEETGDWYEMYIEEPVRELVHFLRDNGINTQCDVCVCMCLPSCVWFLLKKFN